MFKIYIKRRDFFLSEKDVLANVGILFCSWFFECITDKIWNDLSLFDVVWFSKCQDLVLS